MNGPETPFPADQVPRPPPRPPPKSGPQRPLTGPLRWFRAVANCSLGKYEKLVLYAVGPHLNWKTWECRPSMRTVARNAGLTERGVGKVISRLESLGVLRFVNRSVGGAGRTHVLAADPENLETVNPEPRSDLRATGECPEPRTPAPRTPNPVPKTPNPVRRNRPSIHNTPHEQTIHSPEMEACASARPWMDGSGTAKDTLLACRVAGPILEALVATPAITAEEVRREWQSVNTDRRVRNPTAVLVHRLVKRHGVVVASRRSIAPDLQMQSDSIQRLRQKHIEESAHQAATSNRPHARP